MSFYVTNFNHFFFLGVVNLKFSSFILENFFFASISLHLFDAINDFLDFLELIFLLFFFVVWFKYPFWVIFVGFLVEIS